MTGKVFYIKKAYKILELTFGDSIKQGKEKPQKKVKEEESKVDLDEPQNPKAPD